MNGLEDSLHLILVYHTGVLRGVVRGEFCVLCCNVVLPLLCVYKRKSFRYKSLSQKKLIRGNESKEALFCICSVCLITKIHSCQLSEAERFK